jgi:hypothetical protein
MDARAVKVETPKTWPSLSLAFTASGRGHDGARKQGSGEARGSRDRAPGESGREQPYRSDGPIVQRKRVP